MMQIQNKPDNHHLVLYGLICAEALQVSDLTRQLRQSASGELTGSLLIDLVNVITCIMVYLDSAGLPNPLTPMKLLLK